MLDEVGGFEMGWGQMGYKRVVNVLEICIRFILLISIQIAYRRLIEETNPESKVHISFQVRPA